MSKLLKLMAAAGVALSLSTAASAAMITQWNYKLTSNWASANASSSNLTGVGTQQISWGVPLNTGGQQSSLRVQDPAVGIVNTNGAQAAGVTVTHANNVLNSAGGSLLSARLFAELRLVPFDLDPNIAPPRAQSIDIKFVETPNVAGSCAVTSPTPCNDLFVLTNPSQVLTADSFILDGYQYTVRVFPLNASSFATLPAGACAQAGVAAGCIGFTTPENQTTSVPFGFTVTARQVSEPGVLALAGLGLAGLGFAARRRKAA